MVRKTQVLISLSAVSGPLLLSVDAGTGLGGRFGYSNLKEAAFSGAAALWELDGV
jgi:hypothetical protein